MFVYYFLLPSIIISDLFSFIVIEDLLLKKIKKLCQFMCIEKNVSTKSQIKPGKIELVEFGLGEVHFRMLGHELLEDVLFLLLLRRRQTQFLLALIIHHFLNLELENLTSK